MCSYTTTLPGASTKVAPSWFVRFPGQWIRCPAARGGLGTGTAALVVQQHPEVHPLHLRGAGREAVVVDQHRERHVLVLDERRRVLHAARPDGDDLTAESSDLLVVVAELRGVLAAEQSAEMSEEHHGDGPFGPEVAEAAPRAGRIDQLHVGQALCVHCRTVPLRCATMTP